MEGYLGSPQGLPLLPSPETSLDETRVGVQKLEVKVDKPDLESDPVVEGLGSLEEDNGHLVDVVDPFFLAFRPSGTTVLWSTFDLVIGRN